MKTHVLIIMTAVLCLLSCGNHQNSSQSNNGSSVVKFAPKERTSSLTDAERQTAIAQKQQETEVNIETLISPHSLRLTVLPPAITDDITDAVCEQIIMQLLRITSANGISGVNGSSPMAFALAMNPVERKVTGTVPQKMLISYDATYYILNMQTWDVYASYATQVTGVGDSFELATSSAVRELKNSSEIQQMIAQAEVNVVTWFENNIHTLQNRVTQACSSQNYAAALAVLNAVPEQAINCHKWASEQVPFVIDQLKKQVAHVELAALKDAIAMAMSEYNPAVGAHLAMLPLGTPEAEEGTRLYAQYMQQIDKERLRKLDLEERKRLEALELQKLQMQYEHEATMKEMEAQAAETKNAGNSSKGSSIKSFFNGVSVWSMISQVLSRCLFLF
ncbi:MAG: hypothetical protein J6S09_10505 [Paludibacteraceae bacterium]|nr:hypothetical protein [Paludibacteraceae bacterium]